MTDGDGSLIIRAGVLEDAQVLADFNAAMALETENVRLDPPTVLAGCRAVLEDPGKGQYFVAESGGRIVGQLLVTREWSDWRNGDMWWVQSVYVHPEHRRKGVFRALYRHVVREAAARGVAAIRLYVEEHNHAAQHTYRGMGMRVTYYRVMEQILRGPGASR